MILKAPRYFLDEIVAPACNNDKDIIQAFADIPRSLFVDEGMKFKAYEDKALPIGMGQTISQVTTVANMLYMLELKKEDTVDAAISQIRERRYPEALEKYRDNLILVAITYDSKTKEHRARIEKA